MPLGDHLKTRLRVLQRSKSKAGAPSTVRRVWGDVFLNQSLQNQWYPANWESVEDDELGFLIPSLAAWDAEPGAVPGRSGTVDGPPQRIRRVLIDRIVAASERFGGRHDDLLPGADFRLALERSRAVTSIDWQAMFDEGGAGHLRASQMCQPSLVHELCVLECLDRLHGDATRRTVANDPVDPAPDLAHCVAASIHSGINAGYVYEEYRWAHELLLTAVWIGYLLKGRAALMPVPVAQCLVDYLQPETPIDADSEIGRACAILSHYGEIAAGEQRLLAIARRVLRTRYTAISHPRLTGWRHGEESVYPDRERARLIVGRLGH